MRPAAGTGPPSAAPSGHPTATAASVPGETATVHGLLTDAATRYPDRTALIARDIRWSYAELAERSRDTARVLARAGVRHGDRVALLGGNSAPLVAALFGANSLGAAFAVISPTTKPYQLRHMLLDCSPAVVLADPDFAARVAGTGVDVPVLPLLPEPGRAGPPGPAPAPAGVDPDRDPAALIYTSGSTAMPKAVVSTHTNVRFATGAIQERLGMGPDDVIGCFLPLAFDYGLYQIFLACASGAALALGTMTDVGPGLLHRMRQWEVTVLPAMPSMASVLLTLARRGTRKPPLRMVTNTGAHLPASHATALRELFPGTDVYPMFGLTECKRVSILLPGDRPARTGSVGRPLPGTACRIIDEHGRSVPPGIPGELVVSGPHVMAGYWRAPELTARRFRDDGPDGRRELFAGDVCSMDEDGFLYFHGRRDDIFKQRGFRVSALEIESAALDIPGVTAAALLHGDGEETVVHVAGPDTAEARVMAGLRERLDDHKLPARIVPHRALPLTDNGKTDKTALRAASEER